LGCHGLRLAFTECMRDDGRDAKERGKKSSFFVLLDRCAGIFRCGHDSNRIGLGARRGSGPVWCALRCREALCPLLALLLVGSGREAGNRRELARRSGVPTATVYEVCRYHRAMLSGLLPVPVWAIARSETRVRNYWRNRTFTTPSCTHLPHCQSMPSRLRWLVCSTGCWNL
jgi:hypothetical protein